MRWSSTNRQCTRRGCLLILISTFKTFNSSATSKLLCSAFLIINLILSFCANLFEQKTKKVNVQARVEKLVIGVSKIDSFLQGNQTIETTITLQLSTCIISGMIYSFLKSHFYWVWKSLGNCLYTKFCFVWDEVNKPMDEKVNKFEKNLSLCTYPCEKGI